MSASGKYTQKAAAIYCRSNSAHLLDQLREYAGDQGLEIVFNEDGVASAGEIIDEANKTFLPLFFNILVSDEEHFADFSHQVEVEDSDGRAHIGALQIIPLPNK